MPYYALIDHIAPIVISCSLLLFFFLIHVLLFRFVPVLRKTFVLVLLSFVVFGIGVGLGPLVPLWNTLFPKSLSEILLLLQFHIFMTFTYIICYSAIEQQSPSLMIIKRVHAAGINGSSVEAIKALVDDKFLIEQRIDPIVQSKMATRSGDDLILLPRGKLLSTIFSVYRGYTNNTKGS